MRPVVDLIRDGYQVNPTMADLLDEGRPVARRIPFYEDNLAT